MKSQKFPIKSGSVSWYVSLRLLLSCFQKNSDNTEFGGDTFSKASQMNLVGPINLSMDVVGWLHFLSTLVSLLHHRQLAVGIRDWKVGVGRVLGAVQEQRPVHDVTWLSWTMNESNLQRPLASRVLSPGVGGHEGPLGESILTIIIIWSLRQNHGAKNWDNMSSSIFIHISPPTLPHN